jgi:putative ABC transport system permease protein
MTWRSAVGLAVRSLWRRPGRAVLTVLAVLLASALLTALLTIATTAETRVLDELAKGGPLAGIKVAPASPDPTQVGQDEATGAQPHDIDDAALARIRSLPTVREAIPVVVTRMLVVPPPRPPSGPDIDRAPATSAPGTSGSQARNQESFLETAVGLDIRATPSMPITVLNGRLPAPGSLDQVAVSERTLDRLGVARTDAERAVGIVLRLAAPQVSRQGDRPSTRLRWTKATVVGVVAQEAAEGGILAPAETVMAARQWSLSGIDDQRIGISRSPYAGVYVVAHSLDDVGAARAQITAVGYATSAPENLIASVRRYLHVVEIVLSAVGVIALTVAALGISNAMLAAVRERRREIGVIKAIGGRDRDVRRIFLVEAGSLGFVGGLLGAGTGWLVAQAVGRVVNGYLAEQGLRPIELTLPFTTMGATVAGATALALLAGTLPALRAARLPAREAVGAV